MKSQIIVLCIILTVGYACSPSGLSTTGRQHANANANRREKLKDKALEATIRNIQKLNPQGKMTFIKGGWRYRDFLVLLSRTRRPSTFGAQGLECFSIFSIFSISKIKANLLG